MLILIINPYAPNSTVFNYMDSQSVNPDNYSVRIES
jgi:hypothetical protein